MRLLTILVILMGSFIGVRAQKVLKTNNINRGIASYYHPKFEGRKTATGEVFTNDKYTCANNQLKLGTFIKVTNLNNGKVVYVKVNDRMAANNPRLVDLTSAAAEKLKFKDQGTTNVRYDVVTEAEGRSGILAQREIGGRRNTL